MIECVSPILSVRSIGRSLAFYTSVLGFDVVFQESGFAGIARDGSGIYLCEGGQGQPGAWIWIGVEDARAFHEDVVARGATVRHAPQNYPWALEFKVDDPDGNVLRIGSEPDPSLPFESFTM